MNKDERGKIGKKGNQRMKGRMQSEKENKKNGTREQRWEEETKDGPDKMRILFT